jgi:hypothetical protein
MSKTVHSVKLIAYDSVDLAKLSYQNGDVVYDTTNTTLRIMDGTKPGGWPIATQSWVNQNSLTVSTLAPAIASALSTQLANYSTTAQIASTYVTNTALATALAGLNTGGGGSTYSLPIAVSYNSLTTPGGALGGVIPDGTTITINPATGVISGANTYTLPKAVAANVGGGVLGGVIPDGTTILYNPTTGVISGAVNYSLPVATASTIGGVSVAANNGLSLSGAGALALTTAIAYNSIAVPGGRQGGVIPDGTTITINNGVISGYAGYTLPAATTAALGGVIIPVTANSGFTNSSGTIRLATASTTQLGGVKVDGATIIINGNGQISAQITGAIVFQGSWDASANTPYLVNGTGTNGFEYVVIKAGTVNFGAGNITFAIGDNVIYNGTIWVRVPLGSSAGQTSQSLTFNSSGTGGTSPSSFNGSAAVTISYNTIGAEPAGGSSDIVTVGTIATGTWQGTLIGPTYGGTGVNNGSYTLTITGGSRTLDQAVNNGAAPTFLGTNFTSIPNAALSNNSITFGSTATALGGTVTNLNGVNIGPVTAGTGSFTSLTATGAITHNTSTNSQSYVTTGAGTITITSGTAGAINNMSIGATTRGSGAFTSVAANSTVTFQTTTNSQSYTTTSTATITISSGSLGTLDNMTIGGTTPAAGTFTGITINGATSVPGITTSTTGVSSTAWTTNGINLRLQAKTFTDTSSLGTIASSYINAMSTPTFTSSSSVTITDAANLYVAAPAASGSTTITNASAILTNGIIKSTVTTGTAPFVVASSTNIPNLNASSLNGATFASPGIIGGTSASSATFTGVTINGASVNTSISPTGTGTVTINPAGAISITGSSTLTLGTSNQTTTMAGNITATTSNQTVTLSPTGTGTVKIQPATSGLLDNIVIGSSTAVAATFTNVTTTGYYYASVNAAVNAAGITSGTATPLSKQINIVTVSSGTATGVQLPAVVVGNIVYIYNTSGNTITVYPPTGVTIASNASYSLTSGSGNRFVAATSSIYYPF